MRRAVAIAALSAALLLAVPLSAGAAKPEPFTITCGGVEYSITSGNGKWAVGKVVGSSTHFIPKRFVFTARDAGGNVVFQEVEEKKGHRNQETITCTFSGEFVDEEGQTFFFTGTAEVVRRP